MPHIVVQPTDVRDLTLVDREANDNYLGVRFQATPTQPSPEQPFPCELELMYYPRVNYDQVCEGASFTLREGGRVIGFGVVLQRFG